MATKSPSEGQVKPDVGDTLIVIREFYQRQPETLWHFLRLLDLLTNIAQMTFTPAAPMS
jgi:hypothetical protein